MKPIVKLLCCGAFLLNAQAYAEYYDVLVVNHTQHQIVISSPWISIYGDHGTTNNNPIQPEQTVDVVAISPNQPTKVQGSYDVWDANGRWLGNCTLSVSGNRDNFKGSYSEQYCTNGVSVIAVKDDHSDFWHPRRGGDYIFTIG